MQLAILGRQPAISLAELESLYGAENVTPVSEYAALVKSDDPLRQIRLGGTMKSARVLTRLENTDLEKAFLYLQSSIPDHLSTLPEGKLQFGVSVYGFKAQRDWLLRQMLTLKKIIKKNGRSVRIIENKSEALESAQVLYNKLTGPLGWELLLVKDGADVILAQTTAVQDIDAYSKRDFDRPMRDSYVGMLPPKLAQIMINLAVGEQILELRSQSLDEANSKIQDLSSKICVLDPFCGTGVVLQEALLMGYDAYGSDLSEKMVEYSTANLKWLEEKYLLPSRHPELAEGPGSKLGPSAPLRFVQDDTLQWNVEQGDATKHIWDLSKNQGLRSKICVVGETYLGKPLTSLPKPDILNPIISESNQIAEDFLKNLAPQISTGTKLCLALPAWYLGNNEFLHLKVLDHLEDMGYNRLDLVHARNEDLIYHRENQIVARELTILVRS
jgi:tRNA G10  N-methylase Trm11